MLKLHHNINWAKLFGEIKAIIIENEADKMSNLLRKKQEDKILDEYKPPDCHRMNQTHQSIWLFWLRSGSLNAKTVV
jgi:hypothetical protein